MASMKQLTSQRPFHVVPEPMIDDNDRLIQMLILSRVHSSFFSPVFVGDSTAHT